MSTGHLAFIRSETCTDSWDYYESKTEVLVFGDRKGYRYWREQIARAQRTKGAVRLSLLHRHPTSMRGVILLAADTAVRKPRVKLIERFVPTTTGPNMELVTFANRAGLKYLAAKLTQLEKQALGNPSEHVQLDDLIDPVIVPRSVALSLRAPVTEWTPECFGEYADLLLKRCETFLPTLFRDNGTQGYQEITSEQSHFLEF